MQGKSKVFMMLTDEDTSMSLTEYQFSQNFKKIYYTMVKYMSIIMEPSIEEGVKVASFYTATHYHIATILCGFLSAS